jgi:DNA-binding winged helix-turn-helix (wHTH) protein
MTTNIPHLLTEATEKKLFEATLLPYFLRGENVTALWVRHAGRRRIGHFLAQFSEHFNFSTLGKYKIIVIPHGDLIEETPQGFFQLMLSCLSPAIVVNKEEETYPALKQEIKKLTQEGYHLIFILERFDELSAEPNFPSSFFNNLHSLWLIDRSKVHYLFSLATNIFKSDYFDKLCHLKEVVSQNLVYFPLLEEEDNEANIQYLTNKYSFKNTPKQKNIVKKICGGHVSLNRAALRILQSFYSSNEEKIIDFLSDQYEIKVILEDIWNSFDDLEKKILALVSQGSTFKADQIPERLVKLRILKAKEKSSWNLFSPLLANFIIKVEGSTAALSIDSKNGEILINNQPAREKITLQEYHLLSSFINKKNSVLSRDQIAHSLWGKDFEEKYSDWAIDQVISQLRTKMKKLGIPSSKLQTIRNRGYRWVE